MDAQKLKEKIEESFMANLTDDDDDDDDEHGDCHDDDDDDVLDFSDFMQLRSSPSF